MTTANTEKNQKIGRFSFANLIGIIWSIHVLLASLLYPRFLLPRYNLPDAENAKKERLYEGLSIFFGILIMVINILVLLILFTRPNLIAFAKVLFVLFTWLLVGAIYIIFNHLRSIYNLLSLLEDDAIQSRDQSVMLIRAGQAALQAGYRKLPFSQEIENENLSFVDLLKKIGPLATLFFRQERDLVKIGMETFKLLFRGSRIFKKLF